ncbi:hypothetical protein B005_2985 [Nocardiopsis alba ATCC BAA-2165]|uniref:Uncharacterized protein n=1 Tax=Nocardiopsis alba (strain ATCC BAA-2165 / BE74) TaxID=1205910 RepID=J7LAE3_NOCAA|nr:hypothetical protein B005_2985 [Nocardiopsis alba ATCC BAA-2165]
MDPVDRRRRTHTHPPWWNGRPQARELLEQSFEADPQLGPGRPMLQAVMRARTEGEMRRRDPRAR